MSIDISKLKQVQEHKEQLAKNKEQKLKEFCDNIPRQLSIFNECHRQYLAAISTISDVSLQTILEKVIDAKNADTYTFSIKLNRPRINYNYEFKFYMNTDYCTVECENITLATARFENTFFYVVNCASKDADEKNVLFKNWLQKHDLTQFSLIDDDNVLHQYYTLFSDDIITALENRLREFGLELINTDVSWYDLGNKATDHTYLVAHITFKNPLK